MNLKENCEMIKYEFRNVNVCRCEMLLKLNV